MQKHEGQGNAKAYGFFWTVQHTGIAVPAFITKRDVRYFIGLGAMAENLGGADIRATAAASAFVGINNWGHA
jgi:hypothetical protein